MSGNKISLCLCEIIFEFSKLPDLTSTKSSFKSAVDTLFTLLDIYLNKKKTLMKYPSVKSKLILSAIVDIVVK